VAAFQLDHNVSARLRHLLRAAGHDVADAREQGLTRAPDDAVLLEAAEAGRLLVTHNRADFLLLHRAWRRWSAAWAVMPPPTHAGILILPQPPASTPSSQAAAIEAILTGGAAPLTTSLWRWVADGRWVEET
jgi:hypothetical protein